MVDIAAKLLIGDIAHFLVIYFCKIMEILSESITVLKNLDIIKT